MLCSVLCALSVFLQENRATEWASHGFAVLFMISNEIHRLHPTRICCALHDYQGKSQIAPHTDSLCSLLFSRNWGHRLRPSRICCALCSVCSFSRKSGHRVPHTDSPCSSDSQRNPQIAPHTDLLCSSLFQTISTDCIPHGFDVLSMSIKEILR